MRFEFEVIGCVIFICLFAWAMFNMGTIHIEQQEIECASQCDYLEYEYWKIGGSVTKPECWCIKPNGEPMDIGG